MFKTHDRMVVAGADPRVLNAMSLGFLSNFTRYDATLDSRITFSRASSATYFDSTGTLRTAGSGVARAHAFQDHNPSTLAPLGFLIEEQRTNLLLNSAVLATQSVTVAATAYTLSFYGTGTITLSGTSTAGPLVGTANNQLVTLTFTPTAGSLTLTVTGSVLHGQLEAGSFATSRIITTGSAATRLADSASITGAAFSSIWNQVEGTVVTSQTRPAAAIADGNIWQVDDGTNNERYSAGTGASGSVLNPFVVDGGVTQATLTQGASTALGSKKLAVAYKAGDFAAVTSGAAAVADASGTLPTVDRMWIGRNSAGALWNGHLQSLTIYRKRLTPNSVLQTLTTP